MNKENEIIEKIHNHKCDDLIIKTLLPLIDDVYGDHSSFVVNEIDFFDELDCREAYNDYLDGGDNEVPCYIASKLADYASKKYGGEYDYHWSEGSFIACAHV